MKGFIPLRPQGSDEEFAYHGATWDKVHGPPANLVGGPGVKISRTTRGVRVSVPRQPASLSVKAYHFKSMGDDYLVCRTWDGTAEGSADVYIAKTQELWCSVTSEVVDGVTVNYSDYDLDAQTRTADNGSATETQVITPRYRPDETIIWAISGPSFVDDPDSESDAPPKLKLIDLNRGGRAWAKVP